MTTFNEIIENNKIKFTPAQQKIVDELLRGNRLTIINKHRMNGGEFMWKRVGSSYLEHAGHVYKAFFNIGYQIKKQTKIDFNISSMIVDA